jgi:hypothetical protein
MKSSIPEDLKKEVPPTTWGKVLTATPVVMTVIATLLAGLASSEMTRAQCDRSLGAQLQSKAGDQWSYFQAKKLRSAIQHSSIEILQATSDVLALGDHVFEKIPAAVVPAYDAGMQAAIEVVEKQKPETEVPAILKRVDDKSLAAALQTACEQSRDFELALRPANQAMEQLEKSVPAGDKSAARGLAVAKMRFAAIRYEAEARLNQNVANLLELQVRKTNLSSDRHQQRSGEFFCGMLAAQAAVIVATFALAARKKNVLWTLAASAGIAASVFAGYVYLWI